jgi:cytochrome P450
MMTIFGGIKQFPWIQALLELLLSRTMARLIREHRQFSIDRVHSRLEAKDLHRGDIIDSILKHNGTEKEMSTDEIMANCNLMIAAGSDTTGAALTSCMFFVISNPAIYATLHREIDGKFQNVDDITIDSVGQIPYLEACISEALHIYPPNPNSNPRRGPVDGTTVQGIWVDQSVSFLSSEFLSIMY